MESGPQETAVQEQLHLMQREGIGFGGAFDDVVSFQRNPFPKVGSLFNCDRLLPIIDLLIWITTELILH